MTWKTENVKGEEKLVKEADQSLVTVRPKFYIGSSGSRWASDLLQVRYENPNLFELRYNSEIYTIPAKRFVAQVKDTVCYFLMTTTIGDLCDQIKHGPQSSYYSYELKRLNWLQTRLKKAEQQWQNDTMNVYPHEATLVNQVIGPCHSFIHFAAWFISETNERKIIDDETYYLNGVSLHTKVISKEIEKLALAVHLPIISELTDAGPGVGVSNYEVKARFAELSKIQCADRRVRIHQAHGDSGQNEAERTNASMDGRSMK